MNLSAICIKRPIFTQVLNIIIVIIGLVFITKIQVRGTPNIDNPVISIIAQYPGADAEFMETAVTTPLENSLRGVKQLNYISSETSAGNSYIKVKLNINANIETALNDIRSYIQMVNLPQNMDPPQAYKQDVNANSVMWLAVINSNKSIDQKTLETIVTERIQKPLEKIEGIGKVHLGGASNYILAIEPIPRKLFGYKITPNDIETAVTAQNRNYPSGILKTAGQNYYLSLDVSKKHISEFADIIIRKTENELIKLKDVAKISLDKQDNEQIVRFNSTRGMALGIVKQANANIIDISQKVRQTISKINKTLPANISIDVAYDGGIPVKASVESVFKTIFEAIILVAIVVYLFLSSARISLIPLVTIPISLIGTISFMYVCGFSINIFTLLAMILAIGLVVDDSIVMLENIFRYVEQEKLSPKAAALKGADEIQFAVIAMTITLASVFLPIGFIDGQLGKLFIEFAWTLAFNVLVSGFVALTLTPMMASRLTAKQYQNHSTITLKFQKLIEQVSNIYIELLKKVFKHKLKFLLLCLFQVIVLIFCLKSTKRELMPDEDYGIIQVWFNGPPGSSIEHTDKFVQKAELIFKNTAEIAGYFTEVGINGSEMAFSFITLKPLQQRQLSQAAITSYLNSQLKEITGVNAFAFGARPTVGGSKNKPLELMLTSTGKLTNLVKTANDFMEKMRHTKHYADIDIDVKASNLAIDIAINHDKAYMLGVDTMTIGKTIQTLQNGIKLGNYRDIDNIYDIKLRFGKHDRAHIDDLSKIYLKNKTEQMISLDNIAEFTEQVKVKTIYHYNNLNAVEISANLQNLTSQEALDELKQIAKQTLDDATEQMTFEGELKKLTESNNQLLLTFAAALLFIYLILAAQFESFKDSLLILMAVPFSITGGILLIYLTGSSLNIYSDIGLITLIGLITKNSIMIVEFANKLREQGYATTEAIVMAARLRLRAILMTTIATIFGAVPLIFAIGADANARHSIGYVIVGGMAIGTLFTLFVIPLLYNQFKQNDNKKLTKLAKQIENV